MRLLLFSQAVKDEPAAEANGTAEAAAEGSEKKKKKKVRVLHYVLACVMQKFARL